MEKSKMLKAIGAIKEALGSESEVVKTVPMKPEWKKLREEWIKARKVCQEAEARASHAKKAFWLKVEADLGLYNTEMEVDDENSEIKILADDEE